MSACGQLANDAANIDFHEPTQYTLKLMSSVMSSFLSVFCQTYQLLFNDLFSVFLGFQLIFFVFVS